MFFSFGMSEPEEVVIEIYINDKVVNSQKVSAPAEFLQLNFLSIAEELSHRSEPAKVKMSKQVTIWDKFEGKNKNIDIDISFENNAMIRGEE